MTENEQIYSDDPYDRALFTDKTIKILLKACSLK